MAHIRMCEIQSFNTKPQHASFFLPSVGEGEIHLPHKRPDSEGLRKFSIFSPINRAIKVSLGFPQIHTSLIEKGGVCVLSSGTGSASGQWAPSRSKRPFPQWERGAGLCRMGSRKAAAKSGTLCQRRPGLMWMTYKYCTTSHFRKFFKIWRSRLTGGWGEGGTCFIPEDVNSSPGAGKPTSETLNV